MSDQLVERRFFDEDVTAAFKEQTHSKESAYREDVNSTVQKELQKPPTAHYLYELLCGLALLYAVTGYFIWQQTTQQLDRIEQEMGELRGEVVSYQPDAVAEEAAPQTPSNTVATSIETDYLHFMASSRTADIVKQVAPQVDATFQQLHRDWGLPLPVEKFKIIVDPAVNRDFPFTNEHQVVASHPRFDAQRYDVSQADALMTQLSVKLADTMLVNAVNRRMVKPQWQGMILAIKVHAHLEHGFNRDRRAEPVFLHRRHDAQSSSLNLVQHRFYAPEQLNERAWQVSSMAYAAADPLVEFIVTTYGSAKIPELLDAFAEHDSWETPAPAMFHLSAGEFEEQWHDYLHKHYPAPEKP